MTAGRPFPEVDSPRIVGQRNWWSLIVAAFGFGLVMGIPLWATLATPARTTSGAGDGSSANQTILPSPMDGGESLVGPVSTIAAYLVAPTATATATATPVPTATQRALWVPDPCSTPEPGKLCRVPDRAPNTPTPYPSCYDAPEPGKWCRWWLMDDAPDGRSEVK